MTSMLRGSGRRTERGALEMSLVIAVAVLAIVITLVATVLLAFSKSTARASMQTQAADAAQSVFEVANTTPWQDLAMSTTDPDLGDSTVSALAEGRPLVTLDDAEFESFLPTPAKVEGGMENYGTINSNFTVYTAVSWEEEPVVSSITGDYTATFGTKRIDVLVRWGDSETESQTYTTLRTPTVAEAVPTNVNIVAGGGLDVERDVDAPVLAGNSDTGVLTADLAKVYKWEIQVSRYSTFPSGSTEVLCGGEYKDIKTTTETCTYVWKPSMKYGAHYRVKVWTLDTNNDAASADGVKYSNTVSFDVPSIPSLTGGKTAWNKEQIFWQPTTHLLSATTVSTANVQTRIYRTVPGFPADVDTVPYNASGGTKTWTTGAGEAATYKVCTVVGGVEEVCTNSFGPLYTVSTPAAPTVTGTRNSASTFYANYSWSSTADSYAGPGGTGVTYDVEQRNADGTWSTVLAGTTSTSRGNVVPATKSDGFLETTTTIRVRAWNDAGFGPWTERTVTVGELPTTPSVSVSALTTAAGGASTSVTWSWTAASYAYSGWQHQVATNNTWGPVVAVTPTSARSLSSSGTYGTVRKFHVRSVNQFGVSAWTADNTVTFNSRPLDAPSLSTTAQVGGVFSSWGAVANTTRYEVQYQVNSAQHTAATATDTGPSSASSCTATTPDGSSISWCDDASTLSIAFAMYVDEGDKFQARIRAVNSLGVGPWSAWSAITYATFDTYSSPTFTAQPHISGGQYNSAALSCADDGTAQYRFYNGETSTWTAWGSTRQWFQTFDYGSSGAAHGEVRCINTSTNRTSNVSRLTRTAAYRLLPEDTDWSVSAAKRFEQELLRYSRSSAACTAIANIDVVINGSDWFRSPITSDSTQVHDEAKVIQCWLNWNDGGKTANITVNGIWNKTTTGKLRDNFNYWYSASWNGSSYPYFDSWAQRRLKISLNDEKWN